jgi:hypothetical protein
MVSVDPGTRIVLRGAGGEVALRALAPAELDGAWEVPVLASVASLREGAGEAEVLTPQGPATLEAHLAVVDGRLCLRAGTDGEVTFRQRREDVRGRLELPLRGAPVRSAAGGRPGDDVLQDQPFEGVTTSVSGGGVGLRLHDGRPLPPPGTRLYLEIEIADGDLVPAVVAVVASGAASLVRTRFLDIAPRDRERLVHLVFRHERETLARRRRVRGPHPADTGR